MTEDPSFPIPEGLAKRHAAPRPGESAAESAHRIGRSWAKTFAEIGGLTGQARVLDIGCGPGRMAIAIGEKFGWSNEYLGFDIAREDIKFCVDNITAAHPEFRFAHLDVRNHYYNRDGSMDPESVVFPSESDRSEFTFATSIFTHFFTREFLRYVVEAYRCIAPGGVFFSTYFLLDQDAEASMREGKGRMKFVHRVDEHAVVANVNEPGKAVAYQREFVGQALVRVGFTGITHHRGGWSGIAGRHSQDIVIAHKPR